MATGRLPFPGSSAVEIDRPAPARRARGHRALNSDVPAELDRIVRKCLEKNADRRYQSAHDLLIDLRNLQRDSDAADLRPRPSRTSVATICSANSRRSSVAAKERAEVQRLLFSTRLLTLTGAGRLREDSARTAGRGRCARAVQGRCLVRRSRTVGGCRSAAADGGDRAWHSQAAAAFVHRSAVRRALRTAACCS